MFLVSHRCCDEVTPVVVFYSKETAEDFAASVEREARSRGEFFGRFIVTDVLHAAASVSEVSRKLFPDHVSY